MGAVELQISIFKKLISDIRNKIIPFIQSKDGKQYTKSFIKEMNTTYRDNFGYLYVRETELFFSIYISIIPACEVPFRMQNEYLLCHLDKAMAITGKRFVSENICLSLEEHCNGLEAEISKLLAFAEKAEEYRKRLFEIRDELSDIYHVPELIKDAYDMRGVLGEIRSYAY